MRYVSLFSGIEAASVAWGPLGWEPAAFSEIDPFPCAVLKERFPDVPNLGDVREVDWRKFAKRNGKPDVVVGGSPCQSFSVAGSRTGLEGESGLMWEYVRCVRDVMPGWVLWENVPGALSSSNGEDFRCLLEALDALGYGLAWRVLDAQFFGVAQRRERVFLVGRLGDVEGACQVLFEPESLRWDSASSRGKRKELAARAGRRAAGCCGAGVAAFSAGNTAKAGGIGYAPEQSPTLRAGESGTNMTPTVLVPKTLQVRCGREGGGKGALVQDDMSAALPTSQTQALFAPAYAVTTNNTTGGRDDATEELARTLDTATPQAVGAPVYQIAGNVVGRADRNGGNQLGVADPDENGAFTLTTSDRHAVAAPVCLGDDNAKASCDVDLCGSLKVGGSAPVVSFAQNTRDEVRLVGGDGSIAGSLAASPGMKQQTYVRRGYEVRRLTPRECERLQGFPDDWTLVPYRGKPAGECPDGPRYKALGNSMAVPVMRWIGERMAAVERGCDPNEWKCGGWER